MSTMQRPATDEFAPFYATYVDAVPDGDIIDLLERQGRELHALLDGVSAEQAGFRYAPDKWSVKEVVGHIADTERIFAYRALRIARGDATPMVGFDQDTYVASAHFDRRPLADLLDELDAVRGASVTLFRGVTEEESRRVGSANSVPVTVRALAFICAGHAMHHARILRERYVTT